MTNKEMDKLMLNDRLRNVLGLTMVAIPILTVIMISVFIFKVPVTVVFNTMVLIALSFLNALLIAGGITIVRGQ